MMGRAGQTSWGRDWAGKAAEYARRRQRRRMLAWAGAVLAILAADAALLVYGPEIIAGWL